ncbi:hypothetical protein BDF20DRAFT_809237, partial [Mycotypha africana]|uniref:uncharacterized protein n=1 Tax=Mycotypha africana TaxID=64632 RepID=UPI00230143DD
NTSMLFRNLIRSDGFTVDFLFSRKKKPKEDAIIDHHDLTLEDFSYEEITTNYRPTFVDPGRKTVFTAAIGLETNRHEIRRCSTKEYYHMTGSTRVNAELERKKAGCTIKAIESNIPSSKTGSPEKYKRYTIYILQHLEILFSFYGPGMGETRFRLHQGRQRAADMMVNMLVDGGIKYDKELRKKRKEEQMKWPKKK